MENLKNDVENLAKMIKEGKILEGFEMYYADDVIMEEVGDTPRIGKEANRAYEEAFVNGITEVRDMQILGIAYGDNGYVTMESSMDATHKDWGVMKMSQVAVQQWKDGKIVHEKFYHK